MCCYIFSLLSSDSRRQHFWSFARGPRNGLFRTDIKVTVHDGQGVLGKIAAEIAAEGINISQVHTESTSDSMATMLFALSVRHRTHLASLMRRLRKMAEVAKLVRV
ncbi:MAG: ACT domain-containing protein [Betaproteobacteria bacterium]|nr:ACT domain-containing protein [Betaproteobacteria bacterium]